MEENCSIKRFPNEILLLILEKLESRDIVRFGATCVRFNDLVKSNQYLWKDIAKQTLPEYIYNILEEHSDGDWLNDLRGYYTVKKAIFTELIAMSPKYYKQNGEINIQDVRSFFAAALSSPYSYNYAIYIIQDVIRIGEALIGTCSDVVKPYTMTELHYGKIVLRHLVHSYLCLKWVRATMTNELSPEVVCNFFIQWVDTFSIHHDETVEEKINGLVEEVKALLKRERKEAGTSLDDDDDEIVAGDRQVLAAVTRVVYLQRNMTVTSAANIETLNITHVLPSNCGNLIVLTALYQAVAKRLGVQCELVAFPNHLFLEWRDESDPKNPQSLHSMVDNCGNIVLTALYQAVAKRLGVPCELVAFPNHLFLEWRDESDPKNPQVYTVDPSSGALSHRRRCPFSQTGRPSSYRYSPDSLLHYICSSFHLSMGTIRNWNTHNALHLLDFLGTTLNVQNSYRNCLPFLISRVHPSGKTTPIDLRCMIPAHVEILKSLSEIEVPRHDYKKRYSVKRRTSDVKYAVGMQCFHNKYDYVCIVRDWEPQCALKFQSQMNAEYLCFGIAQPFYNVIAADQSERYVPQENLDRLPRTGRLPMAEEVIAPEFTHFDGFAYVPNDQKQAEYPDDLAAIEAYRTRAML